MSTEPERSCAFRDRIDSLSDEQVGQIESALLKKLDSEASAYLNSCVRCGLCAETCHYYLASGELEALPAHKLALIASIFKAHRTVAGKAAGPLIGAQLLDKEVVREWVDTLFGRCTMCGRCNLNCTMGIGISRMVRLARTALFAADLVPTELQATVAVAVNQGNNMGIPRQEWVETVEWLEEELRGETGDPSAKLPIDAVGADYLYAVNPREPKFFPLSLLATAKIFYAAKASWTLSSEYYDVTNYGLFSGDNASAGLIAGRLRSALSQLKAKQLLLGECGHGFAANRWEAPEWLQQSDGIEPISVIQLLAQFVREGRIRLDSSRNNKLTTLHDPCNLVRMGGVIEEQRDVLRKSVERFIEMTPNRLQNFCCGGGGGQLSMTRYAKRRLEAGKIKAEQIRRTGAQVVVAPCHNCIDQLSELNREYKLGVEVKTLSEVVADALVLDRPELSL